MRKLLLFPLIAAAGFIFYLMGVGGSFPADTPADRDSGILGDAFDPAAWVRPEGPVRVALQVGHWKNEEVPEELENIRSNTGAAGGGFSEWEVNYAIALEAKVLLEKEGVVVDLLPATIPPGYYADAFISIHADGNTDFSKSGFKAAIPRRIIGDKAEKLLVEIETNYEELTKLSRDANITRNMTGYYAFRWWRYKHALHPMTPALILETGFLSSPADRTVIVDQPHLPAQAIAVGITNFLRSEKLLKS